LLNTVRGNPWRSPRRRMEGPLHGNLRIGGVFARCRLPMLQTGDRPPARLSRNGKAPRLEGDGSMKIHLFDKDQKPELYPAGQTVFHEGDRGDHLFVVTKGAVDIIISGVTVETVEEGGVFGEMALVEDRPRLGAAVVRSDAELIRVDRKRFLFLVQQTPFFSLQLMAIMSERLRRMNARL